jgi:HlyD family secretion protein
MNFSQDPIHPRKSYLQKTKPKYFYLLGAASALLVFFLALLPVIKVDISSQSRGMVRSTTDNVPLTSLVNGKVTFKSKKKSCRTKGDTLVKLHRKI